MPTTYTIDASVFINAFLPAELGHASSNVLVPLDTTLAQQAADLAAQHRLRGSDAA